MLEWIKKHIPTLMTGVVTIVLVIFIVGCPSRVKSIKGTNHLVTREEFRVEVDEMIATAEIRIADLDKQDQIRLILFQNALVLLQGQPFNPVGLLTAVFGIYGVSQAGTQVVRKVKSVKAARKGKNGKT